MDQAAIIGQSAGGSLSHEGVPASVRPGNPPFGASLRRQPHPGRKTSSTRPNPALAIGDVLLRPRPLSLLLLVSFATAVTFCLCVFNADFLRGTAAYWRAPRGLVPGSWADMSTSISGYYYFVRDAWTLPLFQTLKLGVPHPVNMIFTDSVPIVAICGRLLYRATGLIVNPFGAWTALCFIGSALSMTGLVAAMGQRGFAAALTAAVSGLCMPALLARWGHLAEMAQFLIPLAFVIYVRSRTRERAVGLVAAALLLAVVALWTQAYLFAMVMGILAAALVRAVAGRRLRISQAASIALLFAVVLPSLMVVSGYFSSQGSVAGKGFGIYSMNLLSPVIPQFSALLPVTGHRYVDATGGQYEGFSYLGAGTLLLVIATLPWLRRTIARAWPRHAWILALLLAFTLFAASNEIYFGGWHVVSIPLPAPVLAAASVFRSSGRFFWPCLYLLSAPVIVASPALWGRAGAWLLIAAAIIQVADTAPLETALAARIVTPAATPLSETRWADVIRQHDLVRVVPSLGCLPDPDAMAGQTAIELQLLASRENVATNTVYAARHQEDCAHTHAGLLAPKELRVYLLSAPHAGPASDVAGYCAVSSTLAVCSRQIGQTDLAAMIAPRPE